MNKAQLKKVLLRLKKSRSQPADLKKESYMLWYRLKIEREHNLDNRIFLDRIDPLIDRAFKRYERRLDKSMTTKT